MIFWREVQKKLLMDMTIQEFQCAGLLWETQCNLALFGREIEFNWEKQPDDVCFYWTYTKTPSNGPRPVFCFTADEHKRPMMHGKVIPRGWVSPPVAPPPPPPPPPMTPPSSSRSSSPSLASPGSEAERLDAVLHAVRQGSDTEAEEHLLWLANNCRSQDLLRLLKQRDPEEVKNMFLTCARLGVMDV